MSARAIVVRYGNEMVTASGDFTIEAHFLITDPSHPLGDGSGLAPLASAETVTLIAASPATWAAAVENAVIAKAAELGFTDLSVANTFIPTIA